MRKKLVTLIAVLALAISSIGISAFAAETGDTLETGKYSVDISWSAMAGMFSPVLDIDAQADTFRIYNASAPEASKGSGTVTFAAETGEYTLVYENGNTTTFTYDAEGDVITFTSRVWYGTASFNNVDEAGNFVAYTATVIEETYEDTLETGKYSVDISWSAMAGMFSPVLDIDAQADTFKIYNASAPETSKGSGTVTFDEKTGEYTLAYENGNTTTFTYDAEGDVITFTSRVWYGTASFNNVDEAGNFVTYTATVMEEDKEDITDKEEDKVEDKEEDKVEDKEEDKEENKEENKGDEVTDKPVDSEDNQDEDNTTKAPQTGDQAYVVTWAIVAIAAFSITVLTKKRNA